VHGFLFSLYILPAVKNHSDRTEYWDDTVSTVTRSWGRQPKYPSLIPGGSTWTKANSSFQQLNSAFLRLKTAEFGYNFPKAMLKKMHFSGLKIFISGSNLLTFDKIKFIDPEYNPESTGNRGNSYPQTKFYAVGLNVTF
jgi:hypothetical protein